MRSAVKTVHHKRPMIGWTLGAAALALAAVLAAAPAKADSGKHHRGDRGYHQGSHHGGHHLPPGHAKKHGHYGYAPVYVPTYIYEPPPPVYYVPPRPVTYRPPQPGITVVIPLNFD